MRCFGQGHDAHWSATVCAKSGDRNSNPDRQQIKIIKEAKLKRFQLKKDAKNRYYIFDSQTNTVVQGNIDKTGKEESIGKMKELNRGNS